MALTLVTQFKRTLAEDAALTKKLYDKEQKDTDSVTHLYSEVGFRKVAAGQTKTVQFDQIATVKYLDIESDQAVTVVIGTQTVKVAPVASTSAQSAIKGKVVLTTSEVAAVLTIQNAGATDAEVTYCVAGL